MKYLKTYESNSTPKEGDYFIVKNFKDSDFSEKYQNFLESHIGRISQIDGNGYVMYVYGKFIFTPDDTEEIKKSFSYTHSFNILKVITSPNIEDLETIIQARKYNL